MATAVFMPKNGMAMEEGMLVRWLKNVGDPVQINEPIMEIETDKITMEAEAPATGILLAILAQEGDVVPVLETMGWIGEPGEDIPIGTQPPTDPEPPQSAFLQQEAPPQKAAAATAPMPGAATPYAKTLMQEKGIAPDAVVPTGKHGEMCAADVLAAAEKADFLIPSAQAVAIVPMAASRAADGAESCVKLSGMRKVIAVRMQQSVAEIPAVTQDTVIDVTELTQRRASINSGRSTEQRISINDFVLRAVALASREFPEFRTQLEGNELVTFEQVHVGVAVSTQGGLLVPVLRHADTLPLAALSAAVSELISDARENKLLPDAYTDSTVTVSNLGMYGIDSFTPIINQPNSAIIGVCSMREAWVLDAQGTVHNQKTIRICTTFDHRIMDGAVAAQFALRVKFLLENPLSLMI